MTDFCGLDDSLDRIVEIDVGRSWGLFKISERLAARHEARLAYFAV